MDFGIDLNLTEKADEIAGHLHEVQLGFCGIKFFLLVAKTIV